MHCILKPHNNQGGQMAENERITYDGHFANQILSHFYSPDRNGNSAMNCADHFRDEEWRGTDDALYADNTRSDLYELGKNDKELLEFIHQKDNIFRVKVISKQETDFDQMFYFLEDKNLFAFYEDQNKSKKKDKLFIDYSDRWIPKKELKRYSSRANVIYILNNKDDDQIYVGKANTFGDRVKENSSRVAMEKFDQFLFFELHPEYSFLLDEVENYSIRLFATIFSNLVNIKGLNLEKMKLVNKQIKK